MNLKWFVSECKSFPCMKHGFCKIRPRKNHIMLILTCTSLVACIYNLSDLLININFFLGFTSTVPVSANLVISIFLIRHNGESALLFYCMWNADNIFSSAECSSSSCWENTFCTRKRYWSGFCFSAGDLNFHSFFFLSGVLSCRKSYCFPSYLSYNISEVILTFVYIMVN